jgi:predicted component of type VI protein secretion system
MRLKPDWFLDSEKSVMKTRFILFRRAGVFYSEDTTNAKRTILNLSAITEFTATTSLKDGMASRGTAGLLVCDRR